MVARLATVPLNSRYPNDRIAPSLAASRWLIQPTRLSPRCQQFPTRRQGSSGAETGRRHGAVASGIGWHVSATFADAYTNAISNANPNSKPVTHHPRRRPAQGFCRNCLDFWSLTRPSDNTYQNNSDGWTWRSHNPVPYAASLVHEPIVTTGVHQHYFTNASTTLTLNSGDVLFTYVFLDSASPPSEIMCSRLPTQANSIIAHTGARIVLTGEPTPPTAGAIWDHCLQLVNG